MFMKKYRVEVRESQYAGAFVFTGIPAANKNEACAEAIEAYTTFYYETELKGLSAVATLEKEIV